MDGTTGAALTMYGADYPHTAGLAGEAGGVIVRNVPLPVGQCFKAVLGGQVLDATEFSLANFLMLADRKATDYVALPIFPYRAFRHHIVRVPKDSPLTGLADLRGRRVAVPDYSMTAAVWTRGILGDECPGLWSDVEWIVKAPQRFPLPDGVAHRFVEADADHAVLAGEADALLSPEAADDLLPAAAQQLRPLWGDLTFAALAASEKAYAARTGLFPINHVVVVHRSALERVPGAAAALRSRFDAALQWFVRRNGLAPLLGWQDTPDADIAALLGPEPFDYGPTEANLAMIEKFAGYLFDQKLVAAAPDVRRLFAGS